MQEYIRRKVLYNAALLEVQEPLKEFEREAERIRNIHREHAKVSIYNNSFHKNLFITNLLLSGILSLLSNICDDI